MSAGRELLVDAARAHAVAGRGEQTRIVSELADALGVSRATAYRRLKGALASTPRKRRADAGATTLTREEALLIAATVEETRRLTGTGEIPLECAVDALRKAGKINAGRVDRATGEFIPLSLSAIRRGLAQHHCHPEQLAQPSASQELASEHPNHYWQIDASISRQFYLTDGGAEVMPRAVYYRGKPGNFQSINDRRIVRYAIVDHCTGAFRLFYVLRSESTQAVISALIHAMTPAPGLMHGLPRLVGMDKGTYSATVERFLGALGVEVYAHAAGNARATGAVETLHNIIETHFEAALKLREPVTSIEEINRLAADWCRVYCSTRIHSRHGMTRSNAWLRITRDQLRLAPPPDVLRELATSEPTECTVRDLRIRYRGEKWCVRELPGVYERQKLRVALNALDPNSVRVLIDGADGRPSQFLARRIVLGDWKFATTAGKVGEYSALPDSPVDANRKEIARLAMEVATDAEAAAARKAKRPAFGGALAPDQRWAAQQPPPALPRAGTPSPVEAPAVVAPLPVLSPHRPAYVAVPLSQLEMARALKARIESRGMEWTPDMYSRMSTLWPDGVPEEALDECVSTLLRAGMRIAGAA